MMKNKQWYKSKTIWAAIIAAIVGILQAFGVPIPNEAYAILGALGLYGVRTATQEI